MYAIAGSHRSGKTTLARAVADKLGIEFLATNVGGVFADLGIDPKADLPFERRIEVQNEILKALHTKFALRQGRPFIADRSPFDVLGYTLADIKRDTLDDKTRAMVLAQITSAMQSVASTLRGVLLLRPLPNPPEADTSAQACPLYMHHVYVLIKDFLEGSEHVLQSELGFVSVEVMSVDRDERVEDAVAFISAMERQYGSLEKEVKLWTPNS